ncbi:MAG: hypothetical protein ABEJ93_00155 [Candidatus Nanohalobium sp.]
MDIAEKLESNQTELEPVDGNNLLSIEVLREHAGRREMDYSIQTTNNPEITVDRGDIKARVENMGNGKTFLQVEPGTRKEELEGLQSLNQWLGEIAEREKSLRSSGTLHKPCSSRESRAERP